MQILSARVKSISAIGIVGLIVATVLGLAQVSPCAEVKKKLSDMTSSELFAAFSSMKMDRCMQMTYAELVGESNACQPIVKMQWSLGNDVAAEVSHFAITRTTLETRKVETLAERIDPKVRVFKDTKVEPGKIYLYNVEAWVGKNRGGIVGENGVDVSAVRIPPPTPTWVKLSVHATGEVAGVADLVWDDAGLRSAAASGYNLYADYVKCGEMAYLASVGIVKTNSFSKPIGTIRGPTLTFRVEPVRTNEFLELGLPVQATVAIPSSTMPPPHDVEVKRIAAKEAVVVSWKYDYPKEMRLKGFNLYADNTLISGTTPLAATTRCWTNAASKALTAEYQIEAVGGKGEWSYRTLKAVSR